jgi:hypothetical protein
MFMPTIDTDPAVLPSKTHVYTSVLDYIRAMRTAPALSPDEALEWVKLEQEFTKRLATDEQSKT